MIKSTAERRLTRVRRADKITSPPAEAVQVAAAALEKMQEHRNRLFDYYTALIRQCLLLQQIETNPNAAVSVQVKSSILRNIATATAAAARSLWSTMDVTIGHERAHLELLRQLPEGIQPQGENLAQLRIEFRSAIESVERQMEEFLATNTLGETESFIQMNRHLTRLQASDAATPLPPVTQDPLFKRPFPKGPPDPGADGASGCAFWGGAQAYVEGPPEGIGTSREGYEASWETQARLFRHGSLIQGDIHRRRYKFSGGGFVDIQAHAPQITMGDLGKASVAVGLLGGAVLGTMAGVAAAVPFALGGLAVAGLAAAGGIGNAAWAYFSNPYDAAWQGYTAHYYTGDVDSPTKQLWGTRWFYGWRCKNFVAFQLDGEHDPARFYNFADRQGEFSWWNWTHGNAPVRAPELLYVPGKHSVEDQNALATRLAHPEGPRSSADAYLHAAVDKMVQSVSGTTAAGGGIRSQDVAQRPCFDVPPMVAAH